MLWITLFIGLLIALGAALFVLRPLIDARAPDVLVEDDRLSELVSRKDAALRAIKDLEFDYLVGKVGEEDYQRFSERLRRQAVAYIRQIETLAPESERLNESLETQIARLRKTRDPAPVAAQSDGAGALVQEPAPAVGTPPDGRRFCTNCGQPIEPTHKFCAHCGAPAPAAKAKVAG